jgi:DNA-binding CsgD family transcriptional regulator
VTIRHPRAGLLPDWPEDLPDSSFEASRDALDDEVADLEARLSTLVGVDSPALQDILRTLNELHDRRNRIADTQVRRRLEVLARVHAALAMLRQMPSAEAMIAAAPHSACDACGFDRAVLYRLRGKELIAESFYVDGDPEAAAQMLAFSRAHPATLATQVIEQEMVRRRRPMAIQQVVDNPRVFAELAAAYDTRSYVAAPIMPEGRVIGFIHADHRLKPRRVDEFDRDALWAFAEGFGYAVERAQLTDRLRSQGQELRRLLQQTETVVAAYLDAEVELATGDREGMGVSRATAALVPESDTVADHLSKREVEVLRLIGSGAANAQIAARLVITEETVKSHVQRILRKLGAANRVEAAAMWLRAQPPGSQPEHLRGKQRRL